MAAVAATTTMAAAPSTTTGASSAASASVRVGAAGTALSGVAIPCARLRTSGIDMPLFGFGVWALEPGDATRRALRAALVRGGYPAVDTADMYANEADVGAVLRDVDAERRVFVTTKLNTPDHGAERAAAALDRSTERLGRTVDLWLMHTPKGGDVVATWRAMVDARRAGKVRAVGVSNFGIEQLRALDAAGCERPDVNQIEIHTFFQQRALVDYCRAHDIVVTAFCPLARAKMLGKSDALTALAARATAECRAATVSELQLMIAHCLHRGLVTIPRSSSEAHIVENAHAVRLVVGATAAAAADGAHDDDDAVAVAALRPLADDYWRALDALDCDFRASMACMHQDIPWDEVK